MEAQSKARTTWCSAPPFTILLLLGCAVFGAILVFDERFLSVLERYSPPATQQNSSRSIGSGFRTKKLDRASNVPCTFSLLRQYQSDYGYFPGDGEWQLQKQPYYFQPSICKLKFPRMTKKNVSECLLNAGVRSVMTIGDSNAQRNFDHLKAYVACKGVDGEGLLQGGFVPDIKYYTKGRSVENVTEWSRYLNIHYRHCSGCAGRKLTCNIGSSDRKASAVKFEHMAMTLILDDQLRLAFKSYYESARVIKDTWAITTQEVYFRYFLKDRYPDVFLVFLPFNHMQHQTPERLKLDIEYFRSLIHLYFPATTKVIYMPAFGEFATNTAQWTKEMVRERNDQKSGVMDRMNHDMYSVLSKHFLDPATNTFGFFDLVNISRPVAGWSTDGQHMNADWYTVVMSMFLETFCNSVKYDAF